MARMWDEGDYELVDMLLKMVHEWWENGPTTQQNACRVTMDTLGLSEKGRRDLRWRLPGEHDPADAVIDAPGSNVRRIRASDAG